MIDSVQVKSTFKHRTSRREELPVSDAKTMRAEYKPYQRTGPPTQAHPRFLFYSHDGLGLGHTRRHVAVARALSELAPGAPILLVTGADEVSGLGPDPIIDVLKLPGLRKVSNDEYQSRRLPIAVSEIWKLRSALLRAAVKAFRPTVALVDKHPFGAKGEFRAGLAELRAAGSRAVLGLRDILDEPDNVLREWAPCRMQDRISELYDRVLVYGESAVFDPVTEYEFPEALAHRTCFCGYVVNQDRAEAPTESCATAPAAVEGGRPTVLATAGGGEDGFFLLQTFLRATAESSWNGIAVAGPMTPAGHLKTLQQLASRSGIKLHTFVPNLSHLFDAVDALVCMGGYNTLAEAVSKGVPTVCVPRVAPRREQLIRARSFERLGLLSVIAPDGLGVDTLNRTIHSLIGTPRQELLRRANAVLNFDGARRAAGQLLELASSMHFGPAVVAERASK
jgi:predicted glycosyltransferase